MLVCVIHFMLSITVVGLVFFLIVVMCVCPFATFAWTRGDDGSGLATRNKVVMVVEVQLMERG